MKADYLLETKRTNQQLQWTQWYFICMGGCYYTAGDDNAIRMTPGKFATALVEHVATYHCFDCTRHRSRTFSTCWKYSSLTLKRKLSAKAVEWLVAELLYLWCSCVIRVLVFTSIHLVLTTDLFQNCFYYSDYFSLISNFYSRISVRATCAHRCD